MEEIVDLHSLSRMQLLQRCRYDVVDSVTRALATLHSALNARPWAIRLRAAEVLLEIADVRRARDDEHTETQRAEIRIVLERETSAVPAPLVRGMTLRLPAAIDDAVSAGTDQVSAG